MYFSGRVLLGGTLDQKGFLVILGVWGLVVFVGLSCFGFFSEIGGVFFFFSHFFICPRTPDQSDFQKIFCFKGCSCSPHEKNAGNFLARILDKRKLLHVYS